MIDPLNKPEIPASNPEQQLRGEESLTDAQRHKLLVEWNNTTREYPFDKCIHRLFEEQVERSPDAIAVVFEEEQLTYRELNQRANCLAHHLKTLGVGPEVLVGICVERSLYMVVGLLGILKAGGAYVPLDPAYPIERLAFMLEDSSVPVLLTGAQHLEKLPPHSARVVCLDSDWSEIARHSSENPTSEVASDTLAYVIYTSGSTGKPKGVAVPHRAVNRLAINTNYINLEPLDVVAQVSNCSFDAATFEIWGALLNGARLVVITKDVALSPQDFAAQLHQQGITVLFLTTALFNQIASVVPSAFHSVQHLLFGGEAVDPRWVKEVLKNGPPQRLLHVYGPTESTTFTSWYLIQDVPEGNTTIPIGRPIANTQVYLLDEKLQPVPVGVPGELYIGGDGLAKGYLNRPDLTDEKFIPNPWSNKLGSRLYKTGDKARYLSDGNIEFLGRIDNLVKIRGFRIELGEIEAALLQHPKVRDAVVIVREDTYGDKRLVAYIVGQSQISTAPVMEGDWYAEHISHWQTLYEKIYSQTPTHQNQNFNIIGWNSSYTDKPIPEEEMREWVEHTVERILSLKPQRVLEIGCGTGLLLSRIAPYCTQYWGTDFSQQALRYIEQFTKEQPGWEQVSLLERMADNFEGIEADAFDTVILNSVIQYFPSIDYLLRVLSGAVNAVRTGGCIFVGDVRSLPLLEAYHASIALSQAPQELERDSLLSRVRKRVATEEELVIHPAFFTALSQHLPQIGHVQILPKHGRHHNELTKFRYDVILHIGSRVPATKNIQWLDWQPDWTSASIRQLLQATEPEMLGLRHVTNARLEAEIKTLKWLRSNSEPQTVGEWRSNAEQQSPVGIDPEELWSLSHDLPYKIDISWLGASADGSYDVIFRHHALTEEVEFLPAGRTDIATVFLKTWSNYANKPLRGKVAQKLIPLLRNFLQEKLPDYMVPNAFMLLDTLPLTPNGKIDRHSLPVPDFTRPYLQENFVAPSTHIEKVLAQIWAEVLGVEQVGIYDKFLELGGHSLLAIQIVSRVRDTINVELPLDSLFGSPTIAELQERIETEQREKPFKQAPPIQRVSRNQNLPLSWSQEQLWFLAQLEPDTPVYNEPCTIRFGGAININALDKAFNEIIKRHESLRTHFITVDGEPVQVIAPAATFNLTVVDLRQLPQQESKAEALRLATRDALQPFDLTTGPLLRATLMQIADDDYRLFLTFHHIIIDGVSISSVFLKELAALYKAFSIGESLSLAPLPVQCADFALWQRQWFTQEILAPQLKYWKQQLADLPVLQLPYDRPRSAVQTFQGARQYLTLSKELTQALKTLSQQSGVTLYITLLAAFKTLLYRYTGSENIVVGTVSAGRNRPEIEGLIGYFVNTLVLRTDLSLNPNFLELLSRLREVTLGAYAHEDLPYQKLVNTLQPERNLSQNPLFQVAFVLEPPMPSLNSGWTVSYLDIQTDTAKFDLTLALDSRPEGIVGCFEYNTDLFEAATISRMIGHFKTMLAGIVANPIARVSELPLLTQRERYQLLVEWNNTTQEYPQDKCIHQLFEEQVERSPDAIAVVFEDKQLTYRELNQRANCLAHYLKTLSVGPEVLVGICVERSSEMVVGLLGILKAGGAYVPLDPTYPTERLGYMLEDSLVQVLLTSAQLVKSLPKHKAGVVCLDTNWEQIAMQSDSNPVNGVTRDNLAYVIYTSGSTGKPKGVQIFHRAVVNFLISMRLAPGLTERDVLLCVTTLSFDIAALELFGPMIVGARVVMVSREVASDGQQLSETLTKSGATVMQATPASWRLLLEAGWQGNKQLKILCGGEPMTRDLANQLQARTASLWNMYGPTETTIWSTVYEVESGKGAVPIGRPIANTQIYLLDQHLQPVPIGVPGELYISGDGVARGYLNRPDLTDEKFIPNPFNNQPGSRLYKTGDQARYLSDGNIEFKGRIDNQVKIRGFRIELGEIEAAIAQYPGVRETVVIAREDVPGHKYLVAYIVPGSSDALASSDLRGFLKAKLPDYMIPGAFVILSALPLTPNGKVDRRALPTPEFHPELQRSLVAPRTPIEEMLASIWADVLRIEQVGVHHNFFELGGHSLLATQVISRVRDTFAVELPLRSLFEAPTIAEFASRVENSLSNGQSQKTEPLLPIPRSQSIPLSFAQARLWFLDQLQPNSAFYNIPLAWRLSGQLNIAALQSSINEIIRRHEALRTNFTTQEGQPVAVIAATLNCQLQVVNLLHLQESSREIEAQRLALVEANRPFNLEREPLLRSIMLQLGETEYVLLFTMHHIISDGWSLGVFTHELTELYKAFCTGITPVLPSLPVQYADFALWQRQWLQGKILREQLDYWKQQLLDAPALLELPTSRPRPTDQTYRGRYHYAALSLELSGKVSTLSKRTGVTLFMTLLAAFVTLLSRITSSDDIVVGTPVASRNRQEIEGLIGFFVNTLVLRTQLGGDPSFEDVLSRVREVAIEAYTHQDLPFEQLVEALQPTRSLSYTPLFQVMFALDEKSVPSFELPELTVSSYAVEIGTAKFDLTLSMENTADGLVGVWGYNVDLFDETTIVRMAGHFQTLVEGIVANPQQKVSSLPLLTIQEQHQLLIEWNNTTKEYPQDKCIHQLFEEQVERSPDAIAVVFEEEQLTYQQLNARANRIAHYLQSLSVEPEVLVGICVERSLEMVVGLLGILKAGGAYVPLDPTYPTERLGYMLEDSLVQVLLTSAVLVKSLPKHKARVVCLDTNWEQIALHSDSNPVNGVTRDNLAYVIYTSGSTGRPKGVVIEHHSTVALLTWAKGVFATEDLAGVLASTSICFDLSVFELFVPLSWGGLVILAQNALSLPTEAAAAQVTLINTVPTAMAQLVRSQRLPASVRIVNLAGEPLQNQLVQQIYQLPNVQQIFNLYGPSEDTTYSTFALIKKGDSLVTIGRPIANTQVYLLDENLQLLPIGVPGELYIGGDGLARGYLNRPDLTDEKFIPNPFSNQPGSRLYKTGDKARYLPDGNIEFLGRLDNQVKIRGFRIELGEIEAALRQYPGVRETVVIAREDIPDHKYLVAYIVPNHEGAICASLRDATRTLFTRFAIASSDLRGFLSEKLPDYMIPGAFVMLDALPLTPNGKVDRKALPTPDTARQELQALEVAPRTRAEEILAQIWREVFHRDIQSIHDNFFELGGDSILSIQIISKANSAGLHLTPKQIFQHQTIAELAAVATTPETLKAFQGLVTGSLPLTPIQHWFFAQNLPNPHHFNQAFLLEVPPTLNPDLLQQALQQLLVHHDALRLRFNQTEACWQQFNALPDETVPFSRIDLSTLQEEALSQTIESTSSQLQASLNLNSGPLLRVALFHLGTQKPSRLLLVIHHLAVDGVSWRILLEDIKTAYKQLESGKPIQLPPKTTSFKHWAEKLTEYAFSPAATKELTYWSNISTPKITHLPVDSKGGANTKASARSVKVSLTEKETRALLQEIHKAYHTQINDILLTALVQVLATWSGSNSVLIDLEGHGREEILPDVDLSRTVGWFTSIFPVLLELKATENLGDTIKFIKGQLRAIPNRGIGYGVLRYLSGDAEITSQLSFLPQAEVSFNYLGQFDWGMQSDSFIKLASESVGSEHSQLGQRSHLLEMEGLVVENQLQLEWTYSSNFHSCATVESLAQDFAASLRTLIAHCLSADAGNYTPDVFENQTLHSDAQQINNDQRRENKVPLPLHLLELPEDISELLPSDTEAAYPLAKMQEFMLHHYVNDPQKMGVYHCQLSYDIDDESLDLNAFKKAIFILVQKHPALRTVFITSNGFPAVQVVKKNLRFSINEQDISHIKSQEQSNYIDAVMKEDRQNLFDVENPNEPLFRFRIFPQAENRLEFLMSIHHAITDGWSNIEFLNELSEIYSALKKGEEKTVVPAAKVYREFVALEKEIIGSQDASSFWKLHLKDHTYKPLKPLTTSVEQVEAVTEEYNFEEEIIADLRQLCQKLRVSPKALFLSTYLDLISTVMKSNRVCVGVISNGRTERLSDPFGALGLFWNMVPFCQQTLENKGVQIKKVQQSLIDIEPYVRYPLLQILAGQQKPELFFATFNFVNFHNANKNIKADTGLTVNARRSHDKFNFPLNYAVSMSPFEGNATLHVEYDKTYFSRQEIRSMIQNYIKMFYYTI
jgi:amino acid adenylation domain-containing protein/non-ribosomal peptide synthase protein (TIGR01720 family)